MFTSHERLNAAFANEDFIEATANIPAVYVGKAILAFIEADPLTKQLQGDSVTGSRDLGFAASELTKRTDGWRAR